MNIYFFDYLIEIQYLSFFKLKNYKYRIKKMLLIEFERSIHFFFIYLCTSLIKYLKNITI